MKDKSLKDKAIDIKGKDYVLVSDRVLYFNETYPNGIIETRLISQPSDDIIVIQAIVTPDVEKPARRFVDYAQEVIGSTFINKTSAMENASTSAVGRALGFMGIGVLESIASADEVHKANNRTEGSKKFATEKQMEWMLSVAEKKSGDQDAYEWLSNLLGDKPEKVAVYDVKKVIDMINAKPYPKGKELEVDDSVVVTDADIEKLNKGEIPY